jgi:hypothetical protein
MTLKGFLGTYWETGMEEPEWSIFQDANFIHGPNDWRMEGMHQLKTGQTLTIFAADGSVAWTGVLQSKSLGLLKFKFLQPYESGWHPPDLTLEEWRGFFSQHLAAELEVSLF